MFLVASFNVNGLRDGLKRRTILSYCQQWDIILLQETHISCLREATSFFKDWNGRCFHSFGDPRSRGVSILLSPKISRMATGFYHDWSGRLVKIDLELSNVTFRIINIYAPNDGADRVEFLSSLHPLCTTSRELILGGDFNYVDNILLDKEGGDSAHGTYGRDVIHSITQNCKIADAFRYLFPNDKQFTYFRTYHDNAISCRLDRFYLSRNLLDASCVRNFFHFPTSVSDHSYVAFSLDLAPVSEFTCGPGYWKCNTSVLADESLVAAMEDLWHSDLALRSPKDGMWWDVCKDHFRKLIIDFSKKKQAEFRAKVRELEQAILQLHHLQKHETSPGIFAPAIAGAVSELETLLETKLDGARIRAKIAHLDLADKSSKYFLHKENDHGHKRLISAIDWEGKTLTSSDSIRNACASFYENLLTAENISADLQDLFLFPLPKLCEADRDTCEGLLTKDDCVHAINLMADGKSPGLDGLPKEFYQRFFYLFGSDFVTMINSCFLHYGVLPPSMRHAVITLLCKDQQNSHLLQNWRPISLLNVDYKICAKVISLRLRTVLSSIISIHQTCAVPGRSIADNLHLFRNIIDYVNQKSLRLAFVNIDQEKAFDRVDHNYMFRVLDSFGFGPQFQRWIRLFYSNVYSSVLVNGTVSDSFQISRSVRQGCSLSPMLYIACLEPLALAIRKHPGIVGLPISPYSEDLKISQYADDLTVIISKDHSFASLLLTLNTFSAATGSKINQGKSNALFLGEWAARQDKPAQFNWQNSIKLLGINFNAQGIDLTNTWPKVLTKLQKSLSDVSRRSHTLYGRALLVNALALTKLWSVASVASMSDHWTIRFNKIIYNFLWNTGHEWLARPTMNLPKTQGGVGMVDIQLKVSSFLIKHIIHLILKFPDSQAPPWVYFARYWIGLSLRTYNPSLFSNMYPNSETMPDFYQACMRAFRWFVSLTTNPDLSTLSVKKVYSVLRHHSKPPAAITNQYPNLSFRPIWRNIIFTPMSPEEKDLQFRTTHNVLPVKAYLERCHFGLSSVNCLLCGTERETLHHVFLRCTFVQDVWHHFQDYLLKLCNHRLKLDFKTIIMFSSPQGVFETMYHQRLFFMIVGIIKSVVWSERGRVKFFKAVTSPEILFLKSRKTVKSRCYHDFLRMTEKAFIQLWCVGNIIATHSPDTYNILI